MTTTATKKPRATKPPAPKPTEVKDAARAPDVHQQIEIKLLAPSPTNPRKHFDEEAIDTLAESVKNVGLIQPIIVRPLFAGSHEIIAGERRYRAAKKAGLKTVPCLIRDLTDEEVIEVQLLENLEREDLNAIEEAESFLKLTTDGGYTQRELADRLGRSQAHIANRIRLLDLPEAWRKKVISQEIPATHARALVPYAKFPTIVKEVEKSLEETIKWDGFPSVEQFENLVVNAVDEVSCPLGKPRSSGWINTRECHFKVTPEIEAELQVLEVPLRGGKAGATEKRALNTAKWESLNKKAIEEKNKRNSSKLDKESGVAEKKLSASEERERQKAQAEQFKKRVSTWLTKFKQHRIVKMLGDETFETITQLLLFFAIRQRIDGREKAFKTEIKARGGTVRERSKYYASVDAWASIRTIKAEDAPNMAASLVRDWIQCDFTRSYSDVEADDINAIYADLGGNLERDWLAAAAETRREFLELHNREQLLDLATAAPYAAHIKKSIKPTRQDLERLKRGDLIAFIHENCPQPDCPPALLKLK